MDSLANLSPYSNISVNITDLTLRRCFEEYRDMRGSCWVDAEPAEMSVVSEMGEISCMVKNKVVLSFPHNNMYVGPPPCVADDAFELLVVVEGWVTKCLESKFPWCPPDCVRLVKQAGLKWGSAEQAKSLVLDTLDDVEASGMRPLAVSTIHAAMEVDRVPYRAVYRELYPYPRTTAPSAGLFGTDHNNSFLDFSPLEKAKEPDAVERAFLPHHLGYVCPAHTSHSYEAGKSRRTAKGVRVRYINKSTRDTVLAFLDALEEDSGTKEWRLYCAGQVCLVSEHQVNCILVTFRLRSIVADPGLGVYVYKKAKLLMVCISPGVLTRRCANSVWSDNCNAHMSDKTPLTIDPHIPHQGPNFKENVMSFHYSLIPFVEHNAPVRTSISSAQIVQAVTLPFCPATAAVSPVFVTRPVATTPMYARIMKYQRDMLDVGSYLPGETVSVLYLNHELNFEDSVMVSRRYADLGGFSTISLCRYLLPANDYVPPVGSKLCSKLCEWWKSKCQPGCKHTKGWLEKDRSMNVFNAPTGRVASHRFTKTGEQSIKVTSFEQFQTGNKVSTGHGQKGVATLVNYEDMPRCIMQDGTQATPDVVMGMSSITNRQTLGQLYETMSCLRGLRECTVPLVVHTDDVEPLDEVVGVYDGCTGEPYTTLKVATDSKSGEMRVSEVQTKATFGFVRMFNQSQMTRERHFTSHRRMSPNTLRTPVKRSKGGALNQGEMEVQAAVAAGLAQCAGELRKRGDEVVTLLCTQCQRLRLLHSCTAKTEFIEVTLPYDTVVLDCTNKIIYNVAFKYSTEPDT